jgi:hypothetical protein
MSQTVKRLKRSALIHYLQTTAQTTLLSTQAWYKLGKDIQDLSINLNPDIEQFKNILDEARANDNGYQPDADVDTYYADPSDGDWYDLVKNIAMNRLTGDDCMTVLLDVLVDKTTGPYDAWIETVMIKPQSYGGAPGGVRIPYKITFCGGRQTGTVTFDSTTGAPTFSPPSV